jgi:hypothetical protein
MPAIHGSYKDGSDIFKDKTGLYIVQWSPKKGEYKKRLKTLKRYVETKKRSTTRRR